MPLWQLGWVTWIYAQPLASADFIWLCKINLLDDDDDDDEDVDDVDDDDDDDEEDMVDVIETRWKL